MPLDSISELIAETVRHWAQRTGVAPRTRAKRAAQLGALLGGRPHRIEPQTWTARQSGTGPAPGTWGGDEEAGAWPSEDWTHVAASVRRTMMPGALTEGEGVADYLPRLDLAPPPDRQDPRRSAARDRWATARGVMVGLGLPHDLSTAQPFEYAPIVDRLFSPSVSRMSATGIEEALYGGLALLHGIGPDLLATLRTGTEPGVEGTPLLDLDEGLLHLRLPRVGYDERLDPACEATSRPGSAWAIVPLLPDLVELARRLRSQRPAVGALVFDRRGGRGPACAIGAGRGGERLVLRLARSTSRWLRYHGLPGVLGDLVAGQFRFATLATSAYVNLSAAQVATAHARAAAALWGLAVTTNTVARWERDEVPIRESMARLIDLVAKTIMEAERRRALTVASIRKRTTAHGYNYEVDFIDGAGVRRRLRARSREQAEQLRAEKVNEARQVLPPHVDRDVSLTDYADRWVKDQATHGLAPATVANYAQMLRLYVLPDSALGRYKVRDLHRQLIRRWLNQKRELGLSKNTVRLMRAALSSLLSDAVEDGILLANPTFGMGRKKSGPHRLSQAERAERIRPLTEDALRRFLEMADHAEPRVAPFFRTMALQGIRPGEALALQTKDVDLGGLVLHVERTVDKRGRVGIPKDGERRTTDLHPLLIPVLKRVIRERKEDALKRGQPWDEPTALFTTRTGHPFDLANVAKAFKRTLKAATRDGQDPPRHSLYDLRHTYATTLLAKGAPITYVAAQMGHANAATTLRYYAHWLPRAGGRYVELLLVPPPGGAEGVLSASQPRSS